MFSKGFSLYHMVDFYVTLEFDTAYTVTVSLSNLQVKPISPYMLTISMYLYLYSVVTRNGMSGYCTLARQIGNVYPFFPAKPSLMFFGKGPGPLQEVYVGNLPDCVRIPMEIQVFKPLDL